VIDVQEIVSQVTAVKCSHVVLTGGEPMLFDAIMPLAQSLKAANRTITIETAGTVFRELPCDLMSISPKLSGSTPDQSTGWRERHEAARLNPDVLKELTRKYPYQLKFVVNPETGDEVKEIDSLLNRLDLGPDHVIVMAEGREVETLRRRERMLVPVCMERGWRITPRCQIDLFGDTRAT